MSVSSGDAFRTLGPSPTSYPGDESLRRSYPGDEGEGQL